MKTQANEEIKKIIMAELPRLMESDPDVRRFTLNVTHEKYADRAKTDDRFDRTLNELKRDREISEKKWEVWERKWAEERSIQEKKWEAQDKRWDENQKVINEMLASIKKVDRRIDSTIGALGARWGLHSEGAFRNGLRAILEKSFGVKVERYEDYDHDGVVFGRPDQVKLDVIVYDGTLILCEIKSSVSKSEIYAFWRKKNFYEKKHARNATRVMVISPMIDDRAKKVAENLNIEVYGYADDVKVK